MKNIFKIILVVFLFVMIQSPIKSSEYKYVNSSYNNWNSSFRLYVDGKDGNHNYRLVYGFNKRLIGSDDYVEGYHSYKFHTIHVGSMITQVRLKLVYGHTDGNFTIPIMFAMDYLGN